MKAKLLSANCTTITASRLFNDFSNITNLYLLQQYYCQATSRAKRKIHLSFSTFEKFKKEHVHCAKLFLFFFFSFTILQSFSRRNAQNKMIWLENVLTGSFLYVNGAKIYSNNETIKQNNRTSDWTFKC